MEVWGTMAENCNKYLSKGSGIVVEGRLKQDRWEKDGKTQTRVRIVANNIHFLPKRSPDGAGPSGNDYVPEAQMAPAQDPGHDTSSWDG